jgi:hypothetical protein
MTKSLLTILILAVLGLNQVNAQLSTPFNFSSIGTLDGIENSTSIPINFQSNSTCLDLANGLPVFLAERNTGIFASACREATVQPQLQLILYPNPVVERTLLRSLIKPSYVGTFDITVVSMLGQIVQRTKASSQEIFNGLQLDVSRLALGEYVILIESDNYKDHVNFVKAR